MTLEETAKIVEKVFECKPGEVNSETTAADIENWDSLGQFRLIDYLDENFDNITKKQKSLATASSVKELLRWDLKIFNGAFFNSWNRI